MKTDDRRERLDDIESGCPRWTRVVSGIGRNTGRPLIGYSRHTCPGSLCSFNGRVFGSAPERGDIVVFRRAGDGISLVKRIVGLPGERIRMRDGVLHIDGKPVPTEAAGYFEETYEPQGRTGACPCARTVRPRSARHAGSGDTSRRFPEARRIRFSIWATAPATTRQGSWFPPASIS